MDRTALAFASEAMCVCAAVELHNHSGVFLACAVSPSSIRGQEAVTPAPLPRGSHSKPPQIGHGRFFVNR